MSEGKIYKYKGKIGNTELNITGRGEGFKQGMEHLSNVMASDSHKFICLKCGELWKGSTFNPYSNGCPNCKLPEGQNKGCYSDIGGTIPDMGIHGIWENHYGLSNEKYDKLIDLTKHQRLKFIKRDRSTYATFMVWTKKDGAITLTCPRKHAPDTKCRCSRREIYKNTKKIGYRLGGIRFEDITWKRVF